MGRREMHIEVIARGIVFRVERVLMCRHVAKGYFYLPGGHVEFGESSSDALAREMMEEAGVRVDVGRVLAVEEHVFQQGGTPRHEVNVYLQMRLPEDQSCIQSREHDIQFAWLPLDELDTADLRPAHAKRIIVESRRAGSTAWHSNVSRST